jgi:hypothetical protein
MILTDNEKEVLSKLNYDLNIWNEGWHNLDRGVQATDENSQWKISVHNLHELSDGSIQCGDYIEDLELYLTAEEASELTLGYGDGDIIGDYTADEDFFLDIDSFFDIYRHIPRRVADWLLSLPPIEVQKSTW